MVIYKLVVIEDVGVGKSTLIHQFIYGKSDETHDPPIEGFYRKPVTIGKESCILEIRHTKEDVLQGDERIRDIQGFILVYSIASRPSFNRIKEYHSQIRRVNKSAPVILVGNKCDITGERQVSDTEGKTLANTLRCGFVECAAEQQHNVAVPFHTVVRQARYQKQQVQSSASTSNPPQEDDQSGGCRCIIL